MKRVNCRHGIRGVLYSSGRERVVVIVGMLSRGREREIKWLVIRGMVEEGGCGKERDRNKRDWGFGEF